MNNFHQPPYQLSKTNRTNDIIDFMTHHNQLPSINIHDPFINTNIEELSKYTNEHIDEWIRASQILLFNHFQESIRIWTDITKDMKLQIEKVKCNHKLSFHSRKMKKIKTMSAKIDIEKIQQLPDDIISIIWSYVDYEVQNKYFLGKYPITIIDTFLKRLNVKTLKSIYKKTVYCYHGLCMRKMIPIERYSNPPINRKNKIDFINEIIHIVKDYLMMYYDPLVIITSKGKFIGKLKSELVLVSNQMIIDNSYYGMVYPLEFYEKKTLLLWKHLAVAFSQFLPEHFYENLLSLSLDEIPITPPPTDSSAENLHSPDDNSIQFILF